MSLFSFLKSTPSARFINQRFSGRVTAESVYPTILELTLTTFPTVRFRVNTWQIPESDEHFSQLSEAVEFRLKQLEQALKSHLSDRRRPTGNAEDWEDYFKFVVRSYPYVERQRQELGIESENPLEDYLRDTTMAFEAWVSKIRELYTPDGQRPTGNAQELAK